MLGLSHMLVSGTATSIMLGTANPAVIFAGAAAGLLPDIDISTSPAGRVFPLVSSFFEKRFAHRSCTHSFLASIIVAIITYPAALFYPKILPFIHALNIGYTFGWMLDMLTRAGVEAFYPATLRCVCPSNRELRVRTGSRTEYVLLLIFAAVAFATFNINSAGGFFTQFNRLVASSSGVQQIYNEFGSTNLIKVKLKGAFSFDRTRVNGEFTLINAEGESFLVQGENGAIYRAGTGVDAQILVEEIVANKGPAALVDVKVLDFDDEPLEDKLAPYLQQTAYLTGQIQLDDAESVKIPENPYQFPTIRVSGNSAILNTAPITKVTDLLREQYAVGQITIRKINNVKTLT